EGYVSTSDKGDRLAPLHGDPERRVGLLDRNDVEAHRGGIRPAHAGLPARHEVEDRREGRFEPLVPRSGIDPIPFELGRNVATAQPEVDPAADEAVEEGVLLRDIHRTVEG